MMRDEFPDPEDQRRYYESLIEVSPTAIVTVDTGLRVTSWNPAAERLFGYSSDETLGRDVDELVCNDEQIRREGLELDHLALDGPIQRFTRRTRKDGSFVDVALRAAPTSSGNGSLVYTRSTTTSANWCANAGTSNPCSRRPPRQSS